MSTGGGTRAIVAALAANAGIAIAKFIGFLITGSSSMLAEAVHSLADTANQGLLLLGGKRAKRAATAEHPFGYGRDRFFYSFIVALLLFTLGSVFALYEGIEKLRHPHEVDNLGVAIGILLFSMVLEGFSLRTAYREASHARTTSGRWLHWIRGSKQPELPVVLLEDTGALIGLLFALTGVILAKVTGEPRFDAIGSLAIGALLVVIAIVLAVEMKGLLIGESASKADLAKIVQSLEGADSVRRIIHLRTEHLGPDQLLVAAKLEFDPSMTVEELARAIDAAERELREVVPTAHFVFIEPDVYRVPA